jgi:hypothetical protein
MLASDSRSGSEAEGESAAGCAVGAGSACETGWRSASRRSTLRPASWRRLLRKVGWGADAIHDDLRDYVTGHLVDETGFIKKGMKSAGCSGSY